MMSKPDMPVESTELTVNDDLLTLTDHRCEVTGKPEQVWICCAGILFSHQDWALAGVFSTKEKAAEACKVKQDFIAPIAVDEAWPDGHDLPPNAEWPLMGTVEKESG